VCVCVCVCVCVFCFVLFYGLQCSSAVCRILYININVKITEMLIFISILCGSFI